MTIVPNPSQVVNKAPLINGKYNEVLQLQGTGPRLSREETKGVTLGALMFLVCASLFLAMMGVATGYALYRQYIRSSIIARYQGFCTIPINVKDMYYDQNYHLMPLRWSAEPETIFYHTDTQEQTEELVNALREELEIVDEMEKITVLDNAHRVDFIHDFVANLTSIVDSDRCFTMELDPRLVLSPEVFVLSIEGGADFDVSRVRTTLRASLPALAQLAAARPTAAARPLLDACSGKPTYQLQQDEGVMVRKRGVDAPPHDYIQFSGRHVQEIEIVNLADLLQREQAAGAA